VALVGFGASQGCSRFVGPAHLCVRLPLLTVRPAAATKSPALLLVEQDRGFALRCRATLLPQVLRHRSDSGQCRPAGLQGVSLTASPGTAEAMRMLVVRTEVRSSESTQSAEATCAETPPTTEVAADVAPGHRSGRGSCPNRPSPLALGFP